jgi:hypothetical protein
LGSKDSRNLKFQNKCFWSTSVTSAPIFRTRKLVQDPDPNQAMPNLKRRTRWSEVESTTFIDNVDATVFREGGRLTVHSVIYNEDFINNHNKRFHRGEDIRTSSGLETYYARRKSETAQISQIVASVTTLNDPGLAGNGGGAIVAKDKIATASACSYQNLDVQWGECPTSFFMMYGLTTALADADRTTPPRVGLRRSSSKCCDALLEGVCVCFYLAA